MNFVNILPCCLGLGVYCLGLGLEGNCLGLEPWWGRLSWSQHCLNRIHRSHQYNISQYKSPNLKHYTQWLWLAIFMAKKTRTPLYRYVQFTPPKPHVSLHGPDSLSAIWLSNSLIVDLDRRCGPSQPDNTREWFLTVTLCKLFCDVPI